jgi:hypothetical protein
MVSTLCVVTRPRPSASQFGRGASWEACPRRAWARSFSCDVWLQGRFAAHRPRRDLRKLLRPAARSGSQRQRGLFLPGEPLMVPVFEAERRGMHAHARGHDRHKSASARRAWERSTQICICPKGVGAWLVPRSGAQRQQSCARGLSDSAEASGLGPLRSPSRPRVARTLLQACGQKRISASMWTASARWAVDGSRLRGGASGGCMPTRVGTIDINRLLPEGRGSVACPAIWCAAAASGFRAAAQPIVPVVTSENSYGLRPEADRAAT